MAAHARLKNEFTEDEKYHNLMILLKLSVLKIATPMRILSSGFALFVQSLLASLSSAPFLIRLRYFARSCAVCSQDSGGLLKYLREAFKVSSKRFFWPPLERLPTWSSLFVRPARQAFW